MPPPLPTTVKRNHRPQRVPSGAVRGAGRKRSHTPRPPPGGRARHVIAMPAHDGGHMTRQWAGGGHMTRRWRPALLDVPGQPLRPGPARAAAMARAAFAPLLLVLLCLPLGDGVAAPVSPDEPFFQDLCRWAAGWDGTARGVGRSSNPRCPVPSVCPQA